MRDDVSSFLAQAQQLSLTNGEKQFMRAAVKASIDSKHLRLDPLEKASFRAQLTEHMAVPRRSSWYGIFTRHFMGMPAFASMLLAALGATSGLTYAAEQALPGDFLYPVKLHLTEKIIGEFQHTPEQRAQWAITQLQRRFDEVHARSTGPVSEADEQHFAGIITEYANNADLSLTHVSSPQDAMALREEMSTNVNLMQRKLQREFEQKPSRHILQTLQALQDRTQQNSDQRPAVAAPVLPYASSEEHASGASASSKQSHAEEHSSHLITVPPLGEEVLPVSSVHSASSITSRKASPDKQEQNGNDSPSPPALPNVPAPGLPNL